MIVYSHTSRVGHYRPRLNCTHSNMRTVNWRSSQNAYRRRPRPILQRKFYFDFSDNSRGGRKSIITARKSSLGQGNAFTPVCLFTGGEEVLCQFPIPPPPPRKARLPGQEVGGTHPTGMLYCLVSFLEKLDGNTKTLGHKATVFMP